MLKHSYEILLALYPKCSSASEQIKPTKLRRPQKIVKEYRKDPIGQSISLSKLLTAPRASKQVQPFHKHKNIIKNIVSY